jgi:hypothetical protein
MGIVDFNGRRSEKERRSFVMEMTLKELSVPAGGTRALTSLQEMFLQTKQNSLKDFDN